MSPPGDEARALNLLKLIQAQLEKELRAFRFEPNSPEMRRFIEDTLATYLLSMLRTDPLPIEVEVLPPEPGDDPNKMNVRIRGPRAFLAAIPGIVLDEGDDYKLSFDLPDGTPWKDEAP